MKSRATWLHQVLAESDPFVAAGLPSPLRRFRREYRLSCCAPSTPFHELANTIVSEAVCRSANAQRVIRCSICFFRRATSKTSSATRSWWPSSFPSQRRLYSVMRSASGSGMRRRERQACPQTGRSIETSVKGAIQCWLNAALTAIADQAGTNDLKSVHGDIRWHPNWHRLQYARPKLDRTKSDDGPRINRNKRGLSDTIRHW